MDGYAFSPCRGASSSPASESVASSSASPTTDTPTDMSDPSRASVGGTRNPRSGCAAGLRGPDASSSRWILTAMPRCSFSGGTEYRGSVNSHAHCHGFDLLLDLPHRFTNISSKDRKSTLRRTRLATPSPVRAPVVAASPAPPTSLVPRLPRAESLLL